MTKNVFVQNAEIQIKNGKTGCIRCHEFKLPDEMNVERLCYLCLEEIKAKNKGKPEPEHNQKKIEKRNGAGWIEHEDALPSTAMVSSISIEFPLSNSIDKLNPFIDFRAGQREAIQEIIKQAQDGKKILQLDAGVGAGKSLILAIAARVLLEELELEKTIYSTPQVKLVEQLKNDKLLNIPTLVGKSNYPCSALPGKFSADTCPLPKKLRKRTCSQCEYEKAKDRFDAAKLAATTLDKLLFDKSINGADLLIVDESSGLENKLINQSEISLPNDIREASIEEDLRNWSESIEDELAEAEGKQLDLAMLIVEGDESTQTLRDASKEGKHLRALEQKLTKIQYLLDILAQGQKYIIDKDRKFKTLDGRRQFKKLCYGPSVVILASGTPCPQMLTGDYTTVSMPNPIPESQRLIYYDPCGKMSSAVREKTIDVMAPKIAALHKAHGHKTLLHCHSYKVAEDLGNALADEGCRVSFMTSGKKEENAQVVAKWLKTDNTLWNDNTILASVGCEEGLDCKGPQFPLNVIAVVPFAFRGDAWVLKREEEDKNLPYLQQHGIMSTAIAIQQATGRTTRGPDDFSQTFIMDSNFGWFCKRYRDAFKPDFLKSIRVRG